MRPEEYKETKPYQNMEPSQRELFDYIEENGARGSKRYAKESVGKWLKKRENMTEAEIAAMEAELDRKGTMMSKAILGFVAVAFVLAVIACVIIAG